MLAATPAKIASRPNGGCAGRLHQRHTTSPVSIDAIAPPAVARRQFNPITIGAKKKLATSFA